MSDEFEDRENNLGELPETISRERGELYNKRGELYNKGNDRPYEGRHPVPPDIAYQRNVDQGDQVGGTISRGAGVTSVYETRPINSLDFISTGTSSFVAGNGSEVSTISHSFTIPQGRTGVLHKFSAEFSKLVVLTAFGENTFDLYSTTIFLNNTPVPHYAGLLLGQSGEQLPIEVIASAGQTIKLQVKWNTDLLSVPVDPPSVLFKLYGQLLLTRGLPVKWETGNTKQTREIKY